MGLCDIKAVTHVAKALRERYETLRKASLAGAKTVRAYCDRHVCEKCRELDGSELEVATLLAEFTSQSVIFPHEIPSDDSACWCNGPTLAA